MGDVRLVVQGDDFGMCHAVNEGIVAAFTDGILTQATVMVPCPWFAEAVGMAHRHAIPTGVHLTLTCEWDHLRWAPLTGGATLTGDDGTFLRTVADVKERADRDEAAVETLAQVERFRRSRLSPLHVDPHMGAVPRSVVARTSAGSGLRFLYPGVEGHVAFDSITMVSDQPVDDKAAWLADLVSSLTPGTHFFCTHPGVASSELRSITSTDAFNHPWAEHYRRTDLEALCSSEVRHAVERRGVELVSAADA